MAIQNGNEAYFKTLSEIRSEILELPVSNSGKRSGISDDLKLKVVQAYEKRMVKTDSFIESVGISHSALWKWKKQFGETVRRQTQVKVTSKKEFRQLQVVPDSRGMIPRPDEFTQRIGFVLEGPKGIRVSGLSLDEIAQLLGHLC